MELRHPKENETEQMKQIWRECFQDEEEYIAFYFQKGYSKENTFICAQDGRVVSMLTMLPAVLRQQKETLQGRYVYAVATMPAYQGKGYMGKLEQYAAREVSREGAAFLVLVPAEESLFSFYKKKGYHICSYMYQHVYHRESTAAFTQLKAAGWEEDFRFQGMEKGAFLTERKALLQSYDTSFDLDEKERAYSFEEMKKAGYKIVSVEYKDVRGYLVFYVKDRTLYLQEVGMNRGLFLECTEELLRYTDTDRLIVRMRDACIDAQHTKPYGMVKMLKEGMEEPKAYMNLMLD